MGISRSASIVMAYLITNRDMTADEALKTIQKSRLHAHPNRGFMSQLEGMSRQFVKSRSGLSEAEYLNEFLYEG